MSNNLARTKLIDIVDSMKNNTLANYIVAGLHSSLVGDQKDGGKVRLFETERKTHDSITPHSHRFDFACVVLRGSVENTLYRESSGPGNDLYCRSTIDQVCGTDGIRNYVHEREGFARTFERTTFEYMIGDVYYMAHDEIHSIVFSRNSKVLFFESPPVTTRGVMLEPWVNGKVVPTFKTEDWMFEKL